MKVWQPKIWLGINPSAAYGPAKRWPVERFAAVAREICALLQNCEWLVFGTQADWQLGEELTRLGGGSIVNLAGKTSLRQLMALLKKCQLLLTNDSGSMHLAAALGTPVVAAFAVVPVVKFSHVFHTANLILLPSTFAVIGQGFRNTFRGP